MSICHKCEFRTPFCHSTCWAYARELERNKETYKKRLIDHQAREIITDGIHKVTRRRNKK